MVTRKQFTVLHYIIRVNVSINKDLLIVIHISHIRSYYILLKCCEERNPKMSISVSQCTQ